VSCDRNARHRRTMEDAHVYIDAFGGTPEQGYFAIYDGHGGKQAVEFVAKRLHEILLEELEIFDKDENHQNGMGAVYEKTYARTDQEIEGANILYAGTPTVSALIRVKDGKKMLHIANCGDARGVLCRNGEALRLTRDHKGTDEDEIKRIEEAGGFVTGGRVNGILAVTRSLGDRAMKQYVIGTPYTRDYELVDTDTHLILACDGIWDVIQDQEAVDLALKYPSCKEASRALLIKALSSGSTDNISVMVIAL